MRVLRWAGRLWTGVLLVTVLLAGLLLGLRLLLPLLSAPPTLLEATPSNAAGNISPRARIVLRFSGPMNPRSVEQALRFTPPLRWAPIWDAQRTTLTISPTLSLRPDVTYRLTLDTTVLSRRFRPIEQPVELSFRTAPAPAVVKVLPADGATDVPLTTPISIKFSRTIVPTTSLMLPQPLSELRFDPPLAGSVTWIDQATALFRPATPLRPGTRYQASLAGSLADIAGAQLGTMFTWSFSTPAPSVLALAPAADARQVAPHATLAITLSQPLDLDAIRSSLVISPAIVGDLSATELPDGRQLINFVPSAGWQPGTRYTVELRAGAKPAGGNLPLPETTRWSFTTAPRPALTGRFPGEGQTLPSGQEVRLIFNTPMDSATLQQALQFSPPVGAVRVSAFDSEVRIAAEMQAATVYTLTLPAELTDRNGIPLGQAYQIRFLTAPASPALILPGAAAHLAQLPPGQPARLLIRRTNLSALTIDLYGLDEATVVRTAGFRNEDWSSFQPERYAQPLLRSWQLSLSDPLNTTVEDRLAISTSPDTPLPPGAYYLRIRTPEGPRADLLLLISRIRLTLQSDSRTQLIWATDVISATPVAGLPVALYQGGALIQQGITDRSGLLRFVRASNAATSTTIAVANGGAFGVVSSAWSTTAATAPPARYHLFMTTDRATYRPGERVGLAGFLRATTAPSGTIGLVAPGTAVVVSARPNGAPSRIFQERLKVSDTGVLSTSFRLPADASLGDYTVVAIADGDTFQTAFAVRPELTSPLEVKVTTPPFVAAGDAAALSVEVRTPEGLPVAGAAISWTLEAARAPFPSIAEYTIGDDEQPSASIATRTGTGQAGPDGGFSLIVTDTTSAVPLRYQLIVQASEPGGLLAQAEGQFLIAPAPIYVGVRPASRIFATQRPEQVELLTLDAGSQPVPGAAVRVELYHRGWEQVEEAGAAGEPRTVWRPRDRLAFSRSVVTDKDGKASLPIELPSSGEYRLHAGVVGASGRLVPSAVTLWATAPGFTGWGDQPDQRPRLIADQPAYRPGETAKLLLITPLADMTALVTLGRTSELTGAIRAIRAGEPFTVTLRPDDISPVRVTTLLIGASTPAQSAIEPAWEEPLLATTTLPVFAAGQALTVTLASDRATYAPGATATLTVTTVDARGAGVPSDVILSIAGAGNLVQSSVTSAFRPPAPAVPKTAWLLSAPVAPGPAPAAPPAKSGPEPPGGPSIYWNPTLRTNAQGILTVTVRMPIAPGELSTRTWAASGADRFGQGQSVLAVTKPIALDLQAPAFFRVGDEVDLVARIQNTSTISQEVRASLSAVGVEPVDVGRLTQQAVILPGAETRVVWPVRILSALEARLRLSVDIGGGAPQVVQVERPILPAGASQESGGGALVEERFSQTLVVDQRANWGQLEIDLAPSSTALARTIAQSLAGWPDRSVLEEAGLLLTSASLSDTQPLARAALDRLLTTQRGEGGWGWWPGAPAQPFITAAAMEAIAAARRATMDAPDDAIARGVGALKSWLNDRAANPDERAYALYVLSLYDQADRQALDRLAAQPAALGPQGLAYLLLARPPAQADRQALDRLAALAQHEGTQVHWTARDDDSLLGTDINTTALAVLALAHAGAGEDLIPAARNWLAATRAAGGWPSAFESARALMALRASDPEPGGPLVGRYSVTLNRQELLDQPFGRVLTTSHSLRVPLDQLQGRNQLEVTNSGSPVFVGYRLSLASSPAEPRDNGVGLLREYLDPLTDQPLDLAQLRPGQLVRARLTVVTTEPRQFVTIDDPLPSGVTLVEIDDTGGFEHVGHANDRITLASARLAPGIYQYRYLVRVVVAGHYAVPAPQGRASGVIQGVGNTMTLRAVAGR